MIATNKYAAKSLKDMIANQKQITEIIKYFNECDKDGYPARLFIHGKPGIGKTLTVTLLAKERKLALITINASDSRANVDLQRILRQSRMKSWHGKRKIIFFDEADGTKTTKINYDLLKQILKESICHVILVANKQHLVSKSIQKACKVVAFYPPFLDDVVKLMKDIQKKEKRTLDLSQTSRDIRHSINAVIYGGEKYDEERNPFEVVIEVCKYHKFDHYQREDHFIWIFEHYLRHIDHKQRIDVLKIFSAYVETSEVELLNLLPIITSEEVQTPNLFARISALKDPQTTTDNKDDEIAEDVSD